MTRILNEEELDALASKTAELAVKKTFYLIGVDVDDADSLREFREDLGFARTMRSNVSKGVTALVVATFVGVGAFLAVAVKSRMGL